MDKIRAFLLVLIAVGIVAAVYCFYESAVILDHLLATGALK